MDAWLRSSKPGASSKSAKVPSRTAPRPSPYPKPVIDLTEDNVDHNVVTEAEIYYGYKSREIETSLEPIVDEQLRGMTTSELNKHILSTLKDIHNPVTHSDIRENSDHVQPSASGHQRSEARFNRALYFRDRGEKLKLQLSRPQRGAAVLSGVSIWIDGFLENTTDIVMKAIIKEAGGDVLCVEDGHWWSANHIQTCRPTASRATHILTSQQLSGSKTHKLLTSRRTKVQVVRPEWVTDSIVAGKRLSERNYRVVTTSNGDLQHIFAPASASSQRAR